jgi:hypothetical protein
MPVVITGNNTPTAGGITYGDGSTYANTAAGTSGQPLVSGGAGAPAFRPYTLPAADGSASQVLQTNGSGALSFATPSAGPIGTDLSYIDYFLTTSSAITAGLSSQFLFQSVSLDGTKELCIFQGDTSAHAVVYDTSTSTFGTPILVRTANLSQIQTIALAKISSTSVLVCSLPYLAGTLLETVVLTISGSTITVGTALATTLAADSSLILTNTRLVVVGSSYVLNYYTTSDGLPKFRAITVSVSTPSIGSQLAYAGGAQNALHHSYAYSSSILLHFSIAANSTIYAFPISVSGTTLSSGTAATVSTTGQYFVTGELSNSRYALGYLNTTGRGAVVSVAGSVASISTAATTMSVGTWLPMMQVFGNQAFIATGSSTSDKINLITDTAGVATLGTDVNITFTGNFVGYLSTGKVFFASNTAGNSRYTQYGISAGSAVVEKAFPNVTNTSVVTAVSIGDGTYVRPLSGLPQSASGNEVLTLRTSAGKSVISNTTLPFVVSIDGTYTPELQQSGNPFQSYNDAISQAVVWSMPTTQIANATTFQIRKVTLV